MSRLFGYNCTSDKDVIKLRLTIRKDVKKVSKSKYINIKNFIQEEYPWLFIIGARSVGKRYPRLPL